MALSGPLTFTPRPAQPGVAVSAFTKPRCLLGPWGHRAASETAYHRTPVVSLKAKGRQRKTPIAYLCSPLSPGAGPVLFSWLKSTLPRHGDNFKWSREESGFFPGPSVTRVVGPLHRAALGSGSAEGSSGAVRSAGLATAAGLRESTDRCARSSHGCERWGPERAKVALRGAPSASGE